MSVEKYRGAESKLYINSWLEFSAVYKKRISKKYRISELDYYFRKHRTIHEARLLSKAKAAKVRTPFIFEIDITNTTLVLEFIKGEILKNYLPKIDNGQKKSICEKIGENVGMLHKAGIIHGDLTTSNIIFSLNENELYFIDFGLGFISDKLEDFGIDLYLLEKAFISTHPEIHAKFWNVIINSYKKYSPYNVEIEEKIKEIISRGRYSDRV